MRKKQKKKFKEEEISLESIKEAPPLEKEVQLYLRTIEFYKKGLEDSAETVRRGTAQSLGALAPVNPELFSDLYQKGLKDPNRVVRQATAKSLEALAPVNPELASSLYQKGLEDKDSYVRSGTAQSLGALASEIKLSKEEAINQETLKSLIKDYAFSLKKKDIEFFRRTIPFFKKELPPFLESKELPNTLKYQMKIGLIEILNKEELLEYFKQAVSDFNSVSKKDTREAVRERKLILEFLSLLPLSESSNFLASQAKKLVPRLGNLNSLETRTLKALADTNSREANRLLFSLLNQEELALRRREYILKKLIQNKLLEPELLSFLGKTKKEKEYFFEVFQEHQKYFPGTLPTEALFDLHFNQKMSFAEIKEKKAEFEKEDLSFPEIISRLSKDKNLTSIYFASFPSPFRYDSSLSFSQFFDLIQEAEEIEEDNQENVKAPLTTLWQKQGKSKEEINQYFNLFEKGVPSSEEVIRAKEEEKEKVKEISLSLVNN